MQSKLITAIVYQSLNHEHKQTKRTSGILLAIFGKYSTLDSRAKSSKNVHGGRGANVTDSEKVKGERG